MQSIRRLTAIAFVVIVLSLVAAFYVTQVWHPWVPDCVHPGGIGECLQYPDGTVR